ncbi:Flavodoxin [Bibersteinia trehalosi USDA-ARS-USMARC-188]|uniref:Flavodoxin n=4 Tax=Bibersteinia trehalosi TaxID=47735 RepID=W0R9U1_BIBTR|nr:flavodoxin FldA [Bibersteinia trehalosi]AGH39154.1 Flavodoxin [Bibersteinia trehalosi USDA-ARS-USMARC-192]AHG81099.1 Flavodoxin [Bibersteinia trehalosi USDA-ARS-USMARC-188]AHG83310.1 Flavodoxin [Bibersteinia trehalosi USDA-ARS-USMARC-189]AHG87085.1 Flavodoxin [Bibersteinia trehalosi USDA-ARS-USMARC-190]RRN01598.1 flavodoxin FldA [Bibersteinia trehalosi]
MAAVVGLFYGSDTGNTENVSKMIQKQLGAELVDIRDIAKSSKEDIEAYDFLLFGIPTWYYGESQADWDDFMPTLKEIDFTNKIVGIFGCGDQEDYAEYFCDAMGTVRDVVEPNGGTIVGLWPTEGYSFEASQALVDENTFVGLCIDEDRQPELTEERVSRWCKQIFDEMYLSELA